MPGAADNPIVWCPEMTNTLATMRGEGASFDACARKLGVGYGTARKQVKRLGLRMAPPSTPSVVKHNGTTRLRVRDARGRWI
jgi:hypothetical protein